MENIIIETVVQIFAALLLMLISLLGTWLTAKLAKRTELANIAAATDEATRVAQQTVLELQQTVVDNLKAASADGKLTKEEIAELKELLLDGAMDKLSDTAKNMLTAAGVDISAVIRGAGEAFIRQMK